jgi:hypothetical protein
MAAGPTRVAIARDRRGRRQPAHAMPDEKRVAPRWVHNRQNRARHTFDRRVAVDVRGAGPAAVKMQRRITPPIQAARIPDRRGVAVVAIAALASVRQWAFRTDRAAPNPEIGAALVDTRAAVRRWFVRTAQTRTFGVAVITGLVLVAVVGPGASPFRVQRPTWTVPTRAQTVPTRAHGSPVTAPGPSPLNTTGVIPFDPAPLRLTAPSSGGDVRRDAPEQVGPVPPPYVDDPSPDGAQLERTLNELDRQADLDQAKAPPPSAQTTPPPPDTPLTNPSPNDSPSASADRQATPPTGHPAGEPSGQPEGPAPSPAG